MSANEIKPVAWQSVQKNGLAVGGVYRSKEEADLCGIHDPEIDTFAPLYDQQAIDHLTAERDALRIEKDRLQESRQELEAARDFAVADAESLRRRMLVLERQRDDFAAREWRLIKAKRLAEISHGAVSAAAAEVCAWVKSGNDVAVDIDYVFRVQARKIAADIRKLDAAREQCEA